MWRLLEVVVLWGVVAVALALVAVTTLYLVFLAVVVLS